MWPVQSANTRLRQITGAVYMSKLAGQTIVFEYRILLLVISDLWNHSINKFYTLLWWTCGETSWEMPYSVQNSRSDRPVTTNGKRPTIAFGVASAWLVRTGYVSVLFYRFLRKRITKVNSITLPPFSLIRDFRNQNTRGNVSKVSVSHTWYVCLSNPITHERTRKFTGDKYFFRDHNS